MPAPWVKPHVLPWCSVNHCVVPCASGRAPRLAGCCGPVSTGSVRSVPDRPYTLLSCAVSIDGYLDDASTDRLILSGPEDLDEVDALRAAADAILVGAGTIRKDNPRLLVRDPARVAARGAARGREKPGGTRGSSSTRAGTRP